MKSVHKNDILGGKNRRIFKYLNFLHKYARARAITPVKVADFILH